MDKDLYYELIIDKYLDVANITDEEMSLLEEAKTYLIEKSKSNMGIGSIYAGYIFTNEDQDVWSEYVKIDNFINEYVSKFASSRGKKNEDYDLEFINYGRTQLVYVLTEKESREKVAILVKQPVVEFGKVRQEASNLKKLQTVDKNVVAPIDYYSNGDQELYVTPYIEQARCVASDAKWGMYVPEPYYRFVNFTEEQEHIVNACMIAKLVSLYDHENKRGVACCKLGGGDFMLTKGWESNKPTINATLESLKLIAARELINCSFDEYLNIIRNEFSKETINEDQSSLQINIRGRVKMDLNDIERGIVLGQEIELRNSGKEQC